MPPEFPAGATVTAYRLGRIPYRRCWDVQRSLVAAVRSGTWPDTLLLLEHDPVFTIGPGGDPASLLWTADECRRRGVEVVWSDRGGDATYHGPGQLVGYPILDLSRLGSDLVQHVRALERSLIGYLAALGLATQAGGKGLTGVWMRPAAAAPVEKVAAIGVKVSGSVTSHGFALNLTSDLETFNHGIVPCGLAGRRATSVLEAGGPRLTVEDAASSYVPFFAGAFGVQVRFGDPAELCSLAPAAPPPARALPVV